MRLFNKVAIVGTGLIGGSLALAIKKKGLSREVIGIARHKKTLQLAREKGAIDKGFSDIRAIKDIDFLIFATPVSSIIKLAPLVSKIIPAHCIVTDVGSSKQAIVSRLEKIFPKYIGSHPLAGSEKRGILHADEFIFKGSLCILTPTKNTTREVLRKIKRLWLSLGARVINLSPAKHDQVLSLVSHLAHISAFSLIGSVPEEYLKFASSGLRDTTRIAASDSEVWLDIFFSNRENLIKAIGILQKNISKIKSTIQRKDKTGLGRILRQAKCKRDLLG